MNTQTDAHQKSEEGGGRVVRLPVLVNDQQSRGRKACGEGTEKAKRKPRSTMGRRRASVLGLIQFLMILHIVQWLGRGKTVSPVEPSEAIGFVRDGTINAGLIFFVLALLSTLVLGRWFCGWGCHLVLLQDGCGWLLKKIGIKPRVFRGRLLMLVPLVLAFYMFLWPAIFRWGVVPLDNGLAQSLGESHWLVSSYRDVFLFNGIHLAEQSLGAWQVHNELMTEHFWESFPPWWVAAPFLFLCGFIAVYFLGSKGFCTYVCPYGGFFAPLDELAPARIKVDTNKCEQCGHCTAVCTSNVMVHREVHKYGAVVDPGCMKCLDCVSACPNDALSFGFAGRAAKQIKNAKDQSKKKRKGDLSWRQEFTLLLFFVLIFYAVRGVYAVVPLLMAGAYAACLVFMLYVCERALRNRNVNFQNIAIKRSGKIKPGGVVLLTTTLLLVALTAHSGFIKLAKVRGDYYASKITVTARDIQNGNISKEQIALAQKAAKQYRRASVPGRGGSALLPTWQPAIDRQVIWPLVVSGQYEPAIQSQRAVVQRSAGQPAYEGERTKLGVLYQLQGDNEQTMTWHRELVEQGGSAEILMDVRDWYAARKLYAAFDALMDSRLAAVGDQLEWVQMRVWSRLQEERYNEAIPFFQQWIGLDPDERAAVTGLAGAYLLQHDKASAIDTLRDGLRHFSGDAVLQQRLEEIETGRLHE